MSYLLRAGRGGEMLVKDVRVVEGVRVKEEGGGMVGRGDSVSVRDHKGVLESVGRMADWGRCLWWVGLGL